MRIRSPVCCILSRGWNSRWDERWSNQWTVIHQTVVSDSFAIAVNKPNSIRGCCSVSVLVFYEYERLENQMQVVSLHQMRRVLGWVPLIDALIIVKTLSAANWSLSVRETIKTCLQSYQLPLPWLCSSSTLVLHAVADDSKLAVTQNVAGVCVCVSQWL